MKKEISLLLLVLLSVSLVIPMVGVLPPATATSETTSSQILDQVKKTVDLQNQKALEAAVAKFNKAKATFAPLPPEKKVVGILSEYLQTGKIPSKIRTYQYQNKPVEVGIVVVTDANVNLDVLKQYMRVVDYYPLGFGNIIVGAVASQNNLLKLATVPGVINVMGDVYLDYPEPTSYDNFDFGLTQFNATKIQGAVDAYNEYDVNGSGVVVAVVDTGVDFGNPDIVQARYSGVPMSVDINGFLGLASLAVNATDVNAVNATLPVFNKTAVVLTGPGYAPYATYENYTFDFNLTISKAQYDMSKSGVFRVGVFYYLDVSIGEYYVPFVMIDSQTSGVYDKVVFDLSTFYAEALNESGDPLQLYNKTYYDHSFADEAVHGWGDGTEVIARDFTGDGIPDISLGSLAWGRDIFRDGGLGTYIPGIGAVDVNVTSNLTLGINDTWPIISLQYPQLASHGTSVAGTVASTGMHEWFVPGFPGNKTKIPGMAPGATIMASSAWTSGYLFSAWFWASGLRYDSATGNYIYEEWHHADVCSNSWGISDYTYGGEAPGFYVWGIAADLLSIPGYFNSSYPGMLMVIATGNGGFGYGTATVPSASTLAISVGASTLWYYWNYSRGFNLPQGTNDVIPWSNRGPVSTGEVKPDVVAIGAYASDINAINYMGAFGEWAYGFTGFVGNGFYTTDLFGGTSQATPMVSGAAAVVIEALEDNNIAWTPAMVKYILMSTADDFGYDPFVQGAGRINVYKAVSFVFGLKNAPTDNTVVFTYDSFNRSATIKNQWAYPIWRYYYLDGIPAPVTDKIPMASLYGGVFLPGESDTFTISVDTEIQTPTIEITPQHLTVAHEIQFTKYVRAPTDAEAINLTKLMEDNGLTKDDFMSSDLVVAYVAMDGALLENGTPAPYVYLVDWHDENGDGVYNHTAEMHRINADFRDGAVLMVSAGHPATKFTGTPTLVIRNISPPGMAFNILIRLYKRTTWNVLSVASSTSGTGPLGISEYNYTVTLTVPNTAMPGFYEGVLNVTVYNSTKASVYYMPVSYAVAYNLTQAGKVYEFSSANITETVPYTNYETYGGEDFSWRWESGDYRYYHFLVNDPNVAGVLASVSWEGEYSQMDVIVLWNFSDILATSNIVNLGHGKFAYSTSTGTTEQIVWAEGEGPGVYTVVIHNTRSDGLSFPEKVKVKITYLTEDPYSINWQITNGSFALGVIGGWMNATITPSSQATGLLSLNGFELFISQVKTFKGTVLPSSPQVALPWGESRPAETHDIYIPAGALVTASLDWDPSLADDMDMVIIYPDGTANTAGATSNRPEHVEFTAPTEGTYTFIVALYSGTKGVYQLDVAVEMAHIENTTLSFSVNTAAVMGTMRGVALKLHPKSNAVIPDFDVTVDVDNTPGATIMPDKVAIGVSDDEEINVITQPASDKYFFNLTYTNGTVILNDTYDWDEPIKLNITELGLTEGYYKLFLETTDRYGAYANWSSYIVVDAAPPDLTVTGLTEDGTISGTVNIGVNVVEPNLGGPYSWNNGKVRMTVDGFFWANIDPNSTYSLDTTKITNSSTFGDGYHAITFIIYDAAGKRASKPFHVWVDNTPPTIQLTGPADNSVVSGTFTATWTYTEAAVDTIEVYIDNTKVDEGIKSSSLIDTTSFSDGTHTLKVKIIDKAGNTAEDQRTIVIDNSAPVVSFLSPSNGSTVQFTVTISWNITEPHLKSVILTIDNNQTIDVTNVTSYSWDTNLVPDGVHILTLTATDDFGHTTTTTIRVTTTTHATFSYMIIGGSFVAIIVIVGVAFYLRFKKAKA